MKLVKQNKVISSSIWDVIRLPLSLINGGFTLIEILVTVLIIGILAAVAVPQYQRAVLKSRYASLMPIAKAMADSNEAYFLEHGVYAGNAQDLPVQGRQNYPDGATLEFGTSSDYSYVLATRNNNFPNNYIVYQKHSGQFPGEIHCEANANDTQAQDVCKSFGPTEDIGETLTAGYLTYILSGTGNGIAPIPCPDGATCDDNGNITECPSGYILNNGSCEEDLTAAKVQAVLNSAICTGTYAGYCHDNGDGTISRCYPGMSTYDAENNKCLPSYKPGYQFTYGSIYNADGIKIKLNECQTTSTSGDICQRRDEYIYDSATGKKVSQKARNCQTDIAIDENFVCENGGLYLTGHDISWSQSTEKQVTQYRCTPNSDCSTYSEMTEWNDERTQQRTCKKLSTTKPACDEWNDWVAGNY